jgi:hypothetical protein
MVMVGRFSFPPESDRVKRNKMELKVFLDFQSF